MYRIESKTPQLVHAECRIERKPPQPVHTERRIERKASQTVHAECRIKRKALPPVHAECRTQCGVSRHRTGPSIRSLTRSLGTDPSIQRLRRHSGRTDGGKDFPVRSEAHTSELQSLMRISHADFCLKKKNKH